MSGCAARSSADSQAIGSLSGASVDFQCLSADGVAVADALAATAAARPSGLASELPGLVAEATAASQFSDSNVCLVADAPVFSGGVDGPVLLVYNDAVVPVEFVADGGRYDDAVSGAREGARRIGVLLPDHGR